MIKFIHSADIHLDSPLHRLEVYDGAPVDRIRQASRRAFENLVNLALGEAVDFVLIAGDLFDGTWRDYNTGLYFISQVRRLTTAGIEVFMVAGNHDAAGRMTRLLPYPEKVHLFSHRDAQTRTLDPLKVAIHGQSFGTGAVTDNLAAGYPEPVPGYVNIGLLHTSLTGREGHETYAPCTLADLENRGYDYWALGHVHQFEIVAETPMVVFSGCIQGRHVRESGARGCVRVNLKAGSAPEVTHHPLDVIRWERLTVDIGGAQTIDQGLDRFKAALETKIDQHDPLPVIARVDVVGETTLHPRIAADPEHLKESFRSAAIAVFGDRAWIEKITIRTRPDGRAATHPGPLQELALFVDTLTSSGSDLLALSDELAALFQKLPADYRSGDARLRPDDPQQMRELVDQAHALLVRRLKKDAAAS
ncbi:exonuclease SbcCD subunit D [Desulfosarcina sp.]|uniref:metallophosphoesterase family protein n=1 Tax=Desulfosarcina sp. TaxID=2027861 RepID=UPI003970C059